jgi:prepilin-type N-terminal cleavage/methylation domain-containing protein/prepilin-type processing-associated H-X9-DG protein
MSTFNARRDAFTLVELLVTIAIIGVLIGLVLPAVQKIRESANRITCANNLRQLALAAQNHNDERGSLPPGLLAVGQNGTPFSGRTTLFVELLPFLEQENLHKRWDYTDYRRNLVGGTDAVTAQVLRILRCPSDASINQWYTAEFPPGDWSWGNGTYAIGSYGGNAGTLGFTYLTAPPVRNGVFHDRSRVRLTDIKDGLSNTFLFGERSHRDSEYDRLTAAYDPGSYPLASWGAWASAAWDLTSLGDVTLSTVVPINWTVPPLSDPGDFSWEWQRLSAFGSGHTHGANFAFADGSVRFVNESFSLPILRALSTRAGGEVAEVP